MLNGKPSLIETYGGSATNPSFHIPDYRLSNGSITSQLENLVEHSNKSDNIPATWTFPNFLELSIDWSAVGNGCTSFSAENISIPDVKLYYPEPFIASPSFIHDDIWFVHILHFQYWLWFFFISLIILYFVVFINVVRWCNIRNRPKRETRGASRSKCADLITACVPVSWAASIIISESVDATDYYDGFGTGEIVIGVRAYQWGWEYYYPKTIDTNYNVSPSNSITVGNSLKYNNSGYNLLSKNNLWKFYKNKNSGAATSTPGHLILSPTDNNNLVNFMNFSGFGLNTANESTAFKKIQSFSKSNNHAIFNNNSEFYNKYRKISDMYLSDQNSFNASAYGTLRQNKFSSLSSTINLNNSLLDSKSVDRYLSYNHNTDFDKTSNLNNKINLVGGVLNSNFNKKINKKLLEFTTHASLGPNSSFTDNKLENDFKFSLVKYSSGLNSEWASDAFYESDLALTGKTALSFINNYNKPHTFDKKILKNMSVKVASSEKALRNLDSLDLSSINKILNGASIEDKYALDMHTIDKYKNSITNKQSSLYSRSTNYWLNSELSSKLFNGRNLLTFSHTPLSSNNSKMSSMDFDKHTTLTFNNNNQFDSSSLISLPSTDGTILSWDVNPDVLKADESSANRHLFNSHWLGLWANINSSNRYSSLARVAAVSKNLYFPLVTNYAEYDFRNWQAIELLEDAFWESSYSSFSNDEYLRILKQVIDYKLFNRFEKIYNSQDRFSKEYSYKPSFLNTPAASNNLISKKSNLDFLSIFSEESIANISLLPLKNYYSFNSEVLLDNLEDSYESIKSVNSMLTHNSKSLFSITNNFQNSLSYVSLLNSYNAQYQECVVSNGINVDDDGYINYSELSYNTDLRVLNPVKLRSSSRASIVMFNAIQKVFKPRFDEGRAHTRLQDFSNSFVTHPFITARRTNYESLLGKNKESFFNINNYKSTFFTNFNNMFTISKSLNIYFSELPFLVSMRSDATRYLWFDWYAKWSSLEVQPSSASRYSLLGVPYSNKSFEYNAIKSVQISDSENYLVRLAKARRNYVSNWSYTPYLYNKINSWYKSNELNNLDEYSTLNLLSTLETIHWDSNSRKGLDNYLIGGNYTSTPSFSGINTPYRSSWRPTSGIQSLYYNSGTFVDILSKREYCYREYFLSKNKIINLPAYLVASPQNPLLIELKNSYGLIDPITFGSEVSRELFYGNLDNWSLILSKNILLTLNQLMINQSGIDIKYLVNYLFLDISNYTKTLNMLDSNKNLYKNQYKPMRKGITNMIRLHATGAIAMPIEVRLHIIASSKDIIHSWAIPSAGIKIDCVPGFSSHRVTIFLVSGIFWGQCMEICGRFHHWMPIIVYFMKRDLFFLWCTHFVHYSNKDTMYTMNSKQLNNSPYLTSYDKNFWIEELTKNL